MRNPLELKLRGKLSAASGAESTRNLASFSPFCTGVEWLLSLHSALGWTGWPEYKMCAITKVQAGFNSKTGNSYYMQVVKNENNY